MIGDSKTKSSRALQHSPSWNPDTLLLGEYEIQHLLGEGGMGRVYLVISKSTGYRYALKTCKLRGEQDRRHFFAELQTWINLPDHPNLVSCRFFRTIFDDIVIFSDFIDGGSLTDWIVQRRLTKLQEILDVAIQFAVGLHAIHECGLVHQDVKPGNVLVTKERIAKISDFGLSRARQVLPMGSSSIGSQNNTILIPGVGYMTRQYASPEQAAGQPLSRKSDLWSWAVSVLEMFTGEVTWQTGQAAKYALEQYIKSGPLDGNLPVMPEAVATILRNCFFLDPAKRLPTLLVAAEKLQDAYQVSLRRDYPRPINIVKFNSNESSVSDFESLDELPWVEPRKWLMLGFEVSGQSPLNAARFPAPSNSSLYSRAISDLAAYEEAKRLFELHAALEEPELLYQFACLCIDKAILHEYLTDYSGADSLYDRALNALDQSKLWNQKRADATVTAMTNKANLLLRLYNSEQAAASFTRLIEMAKHFSDLLEAYRIADIMVQAYIGLANINQEADKPIEALRYSEMALDQIYGLPDDAKVLRRIYCLMVKSSAENDLNDISKSLETIQEAITLFEHHVDQLGDQSLLAELLLLKATILVNDMKHGEAITVLTKAIGVLDSPLCGINNRDIAALLASAHNAKAEVLAMTADLEASFAEFDIADHLYQHLVEDDGRFDLAGVFTRVLSQKALTVHDAGELEPAIAAYDRAIAIMERLANKYNDWRLQNNLASVLANKANALADCGKRDLAFPLYNKAIDLRKNLIAKVPRPSVIMDLAVTYTNKSEYFLADGFNSRALELCDEALHLLESIKSKQNENDWNGYFGWIRAHRAEALAECARQEEANIELADAISNINMALKKSRAPRLRWLLEDADSIAKRMQNTKS